MVKRFCAREIKINPSVFLRCAHTTPFSIHQPSAELFQVFDRLLLLRKGGQTVYFGDIGPSASTLIHYLESNGSRPCKPDENPYVLFSWMVSIIPLSV